MKRIKLLPENLINQIAAGEVIERPASIVKELVENSIDAGATRIEIEVSNECRNIRVADNGCGIHKDDVALAFSRHATSKLENEADLWSISTLGFRGEALASIISVAKVICTTRTADSPSGIKVECENSEIKISETGCAIGTIMEVKNLFDNIPARLKFLKKFQTEYAGILEILQGIAISYPQVAISLIHKSHTSLKTTGSGDLATVISEVYSKDLIRELVPIQKDDPEFKTEVIGYASNPDFTRSNKKAIYLFVNGRTVKCPILLKAVDTAYKDLVPNGKYPFVVLDLIIPASEIDVNVHPSKREIRYTNPNQIFNFALFSIKSALENAGVSRSKESSQGQDSVNEWSRQENSYTSFRPSQFSRESYSPPKYSFGNSEEKFQKSMELYTPADQTKFDFLEDQTLSDKPKIIGQLFNTYILIEDPDGLQVIDQHIAHERTIYEKLKETDNPASQLLLTSKNLELEPSDISLLSENTDILAKYGYEFEIISEKGMTFKKIPQIVVKQDPEKIIQDLLEALKGSIESLENEILITTACHAAVKAGEKLSIWQMEELIVNWQKCSYPKTCPHGRRISYIIPSKEIAGFFGRLETARN